MEKRRQREAKFSCRFCDNKYKHQYNYENHVKVCHPNVDHSELFVNGLKCDGCERFFQSRPSLLVHISGVKRRKEKELLVQKRYAQTINTNFVPVAHYFCKYCCFNSAGEDAFKQHEFEKHPSICAEEKLSGKTAANGSNVNSTASVDDNIESSEPSSGNFKTRKDAVTKPHYQSKCLSRKIKVGHCRKCGVAYISNRSYSSHWRSSHPEMCAAEMYEIPVRCVECNQFFDNRDGLRYHVLGVQSHKKRKLNNLEQNLRQTVKPTHFCKCCCFATECVKVLEKHYITEHHGNDDDDQLSKQFTDSDLVDLMFQITSTNEQTNKPLHHASVDIVAGHPVISSVFSMKPTGPSEVCTENANSKNIMIAVNYDSNGVREDIPNVTKESTKHPSSADVFSCTSCSKVCFDESTLNKHFSLIHDSSCTEMNAIDYLRMKE